MLRLYYTGGSFFMTLESIAGLVAIAFAVKSFIKLKNGNKRSERMIKSIPLAGSLAFFLGLLAQALGLYQAMGAIEYAGNISPALLAGGFKVSLIAPIYGLVLFVITLIIWIGFNLGNNDKKTVEEKT